MRFIWLLWITARPGKAWVGSVSNKHNPSTESGSGTCISSRITTVIHVKSDHQIDYNCFNEPFAVSPCRSLYWDMHGLIFETSIWLLAGSTRFVHRSMYLSTEMRYMTRSRHSKHNLGRKGTDRGSIFRKKSTITNIRTLIQGKPTAPLETELMRNDLVKGVFSSHNRNWVTLFHERSSVPNRIQVPRQTLPHNISIPRHQLQATDGCVGNIHRTTKFRCAPTQTSKSNSQ